MSAAAVPFDSFTRIPVNFFATLGLTPFTLKTAKPATPNRRFMVHLFAVVAFLNCALCSLGEAVYFVLNFRQAQFIDLTSVVLCVGFIWLSLMKIGTTLWKRQHLSALMSELDTIYPHSQEAQSRYRTSAFARQSRRLMLGYAWLQMSMIWLFNLTPMLSTIIHYARTREWNVELPYIIWYPFDAYASGWFELNFLSQIWAAYYSAAGILAADLLLCGLVLQMCMHFDWIGRRMRAHRPTGGGRSRWADAMLMRAEVDMHSRVVRLCGELDRIFRDCILFNWVSSVLIICVLGLLVMTADESEALLKYGLTLATCIAQIFMVCLLGQMLIDSSSSVGDAAWESDWMRGDRSYRMGVLMIITQASRPSYLKAYKFAVASMQMFNKVMSSSWQFFAILRQVYES